MSLKELSLLYTQQRFGTIPGRKALHKILYFVNLRRKIFRFRWDKFGPYSEELKYVLDDAISRGLITVLEKRVNRGYRYDMKLSSVGLSLLNSLPSDYKLFEIIDSTQEFLKNLNPRQMEILASAHYMIKYYNRVDANLIHSVLNKLKPDKHFTMDEINWAVEYLRNENPLSNN